MNLDLENFTERPITMEELASRANPDPESKNHPCRYSAINILTIQPNPENHTLDNDFI